MELNGISAIVTGGASGLGAATARALAAEGVAVTVFDRNEEGAKAGRRRGRRATPSWAATSPSPTTASGRSTMAAEGGRLRVAVNCAGTGWVGPGHQPRRLPARPRAFEFIQRLNVIGTFNVMTRAASAIAKTEPGEDGERGVIVNTASVAAFDGQIGQLAYSASKGAVVGMTLPAARDLSVVGIRVRDHRPGSLRHPAARDAARGAAQRARPVGAVPQAPGRSRPSTAQLVVDIARNRYLNGEVIRLDGGIRMPPK